MSEDPFFGDSLDQIYPQFPNQTCVNLNIQNNVSSSIDLEQGLFEDLTLENCDLDVCTYKQLQFLAKKNDIKANIRKEALREALKNIRDNIEVSLEHRPKSWVSEHKKTFASGACTVMIVIMLIVFFFVIGSK